MLYATKDLFIYNNKREKKNQNNQTKKKKTVNLGSSVNIGPTYLKNNTFYQLKTV